MKTALVQHAAGPDREANVSRGLKAMEEAARRGARLIVFPELAFTTFLPARPAAPEALALAEPVPGPTTARFQAKARELGLVTVLNLLEREGDATYDTSPVIDADGTLLGKTRMVHVLEAPLFHEKSFYRPGDLGAGVFETAAGRIGVAICYDRHFPEYMRALALKGAEVVVIPQAGALDEWPPGLFEAEVRTAAFQNGYFAALANRVGPEGPLTFAGESFVCDPEGRILARAPRLEEALLLCGIDFSRLPSCPARRFFLPDRRPGIYGNL